MDELNTQQPIITIKNLFKSYGSKQVLKGIDLDINAGQIIGYIGPNGAGKTTTIRMITGFLPPTGGRVTVAGHNLFTDPSKARRKIGYLPESVALYPEMRVSEYLSYRAQLEGMSRGDARQAHRARPVQA